MPHPATLDACHALPRAPAWVARSMRGATPLGRGSYASVYGCSDGTALKITADGATIALARHLRKRPTLGLPLVRRASILRLPGRSASALMAIKSPLLTPLRSWRRLSVRAAYDAALVQACRSRGFRGRDPAGARVHAIELAASNPGPLPEFSADICERLALSCVENQQGARMARALRELGRFCVSARCDIDLTNMPNWMVDADGRLTLSDPVVAKAHAF